MGRAMKGIEMCCVHVPAPHNECDLYTLKCVMITIKIKQKLGRRVLVRESVWFKLCFIRKAVVLKGGFFSSLWFWKLNPRPWC